MILLYYISKKTTESKFYTLTQRSQLALDMVQSDKLESDIGKKIV